MSMNASALTEPASTAMESANGGDVFLSTTEAIPDESPHLSMERDGPDDTFPMPPSSPLKYNGGSLRDYLETSMEDYLDAEMEITEPVKTGLNGSPTRQGLMVFHVDPPLKEEGTPVSLSCSTESSLPPPPLSFDVESSLEHGFLSEKGDTVETLEAPFEETIEPMPSEETLDQAVFTVKEDEKLSMERKRQLESVEPVTVDLFDKALFVGNLESPHLTNLDPPLTLDEVDEALFIGNVESPHEMDKLEAPYCDILDEDILNLNPTELDQLIQQMKAAYSVVDFAPEDKENSKTHSFADVEVFPEQDSVPGVAVEFLETNMMTLKEKYEAESQECDIPNEFDSTHVHGTEKDILPSDSMPEEEIVKKDVLEDVVVAEALVDVCLVASPDRLQVEDEEDVVDVEASDDAFVAAPEFPLQVQDVVEENTMDKEASGITFIASPSDSLPVEEIIEEDVFIAESLGDAFTVSPIDPMPVEEIVEEDVDAPEDSGDVLFVSPEEVLVAVKDFASVVPKSQEMPLDIQEIPHDECLERSEAILLVEESARDLLTTPEEKGLSSLENAESGKCEDNSRIALGQNVFPTSKIPQIQQGALSVEDPFSQNHLDIVDAAKEIDVVTVDNDGRVPQDSRYEIFEKVWSEPNIGGDLLTTSGHEDKSKLFLPDEQPKRDLVGSMDLQGSRKGPLYVEYARRSAQKFHWAKEELLEGDNFALNSLNRPVDKKVNADDFGLLVEKSPESSSDDEIVRVPTSEETKSAVKSTESVTTNCLESCVIM